MKILNCNEDDFIENKIVLKYFQNECKCKNSSFNISSLRISDFTSENINNYTLIYKNNTYKIILVYNNFPQDYPIEIFFVNLCCKNHHYNSKTKNIKFTDKFNNKEYNIKLNI